MAIADGWTGPTIAAPRGTMYNPIGATPYGQVQQTTPATAYRPVYGVTYQGQTQPTSGVPMTPTSAVPMSSMVNPPRPMAMPTRPAGVVTQQPTSSAALTGTNALAGVPGGPYTAMPGGFAGGYAGATGQPVGALPNGASSMADRSSWNFGPLDMSVAGPVLSGLGMAVPGAGLLGLLGNGYNLAQYDDTMAAEGIPGLSFGQVIGGLLGANSWGRGTADPLQNAFNTTEGQYGPVMQLKSGVGRPDLRNPNFGTRASAGAPMDLRTRVGSPSAGRGATAGTDDRSQIAAGVGTGLGGLY